MTDTLFDEIRPYSDQEVPAAVRRIVNDSNFPVVARYLFSDKTVDEVRDLCLSVTSIDEFQRLIMWPVMQTIMANTTDGVSTEGFENHDDSVKHMYICNHRDILLDAALADYTLFANQCDTFEITFGSNLMKGQMVIDIGKSNRMFRIMRGGNIRDFYKNSILVSSYMRHVILDKNRSVWIAQRNGRTKDGDDKTEMAVLKMFAMSSDKPFVDNLAELNIRPIVVSYEFEPCDFKKTQELFVSRYQRYEKTPDEDLNSILHGVMQPKGRVHLVMTKQISREELVACSQCEKNVRFRKLAEIIDQRVYQNYRLWPNNYIAYDLLFQSCKYADRYSAEQKKAFLDYMDKGLSELIGDTDELREIFLGIYANPVSNWEKLYQ